MRRKIEFIHQRPGWPRFLWDGEALATLLGSVRHKQGRLLGRMEALGFELRQEANLGALTSEVVTSSAIEGETLAPEEVRSSIARRLGLDIGGLPKASRAVEGVVEMMLDATRRFDAPLTEARLFDWHAALFPTGRSGMRPIAVGAWRTVEADPMQVVSGPLGRERTHFTAPPAARLENEMSRFLAWFERPGDIDPVLHAAIAHLWFVTIHPFEDGNGRVARAIADLALARADGTQGRFYSMSARIAAERRDYYRELEAAQRGDMEVTRWMTWFLGCLERAIDGAESELARVLGKARLWEYVNRRPVNERQRRVINRLADDFEGVLTVSKYAKLAKCSTDTALRDITILVDRDILRRNAGGGRSTTYSLVERD